MRRLLIGAATAVLALFVVSATAQDHFFPLFGVYKDEVLNAPSPCTAGTIADVDPVLFDRSLFLIYRCADDRIIARRFFRSNGGNDPTPTVTPSPAQSRLDSARLLGDDLVGGGWAFTCAGTLLNVDLVLNGIRLGSFAERGAFRPDVHTAFACAPNDSGFNFRVPADAVPTGRPLTVQVVTLDDQGRQGFSNVLTLR